MDEAGKKGGNGMRRTQYAGDQLHLLWDRELIALQVRTVGNFATREKVVGVAYKIGIELRPAEAADLAGELLRALAVRAVLPPTAPVVHPAERE